MVTMLNFSKQSGWIRRNAACRFVLAIALYIFSDCIASAQVTFKATLDKNSAVVGESVNLNLTFGGGASPAQPQLPRLNGVNVSGPAFSQQSQNINGQFSSQTSYIYTLTPTRVGEINIPAFRVNVGGQILTSQPLKLKVTAQPEQPQTPNGEPLQAFLKLTVPKKEIYVGESIPAELQLYIQNGRLNSLPKIQGEGLSIGTLPERPEQTRVQLNGVVYNLLTFRFPISALKAGSFNFGPASYEVTLLSGRPDFWGNWNPAQARNVSLTSETNAVTVLPLPTEGRPASFTGAIGTFSLSMNASPTAVAVGDPITVKISISGRGALDQVLLPPQPAWREFKMYSPSSKVESTDPLGLEGTKNFEVVISPQNAGIKELPGFEFSFFDPERKIYQSLTQPAVPLNIRPTSATPQPTVISSNAGQNETPQPTKEIVHIKSQLGTLHPIEAPLIKQPWFLGLQATVPLFWIGSLIYRKRKEAFDNNPRLRRQREVEKNVNASLQKLRAHAEAKESDQFFAAVFHILQEQIAERLDSPASGITEAVLENELKAKNINPSIMTLLQELFQACNQARYAPIRSSQELASFIPKVEKAVQELREVK